MQRSKALAALYVAAAVMASLLVYPVAPEKLDNLIIAAALAFTAGYTTYALTGLAGTTLLLISLLSSLSLYAASPGGQEGLYAILLSDVPTLGYTLVVVMSAVAAALSARRVKGVVALATGMLAAAALRAPYGHLAALSLLALYATLSASASRSAMSVTSFELLRLPAYLVAAVETGRLTCFECLREAVYTPTKPLIDALFSPVTRPPATIVQVIYPQLSYLATTYILYMTLFTLVGLMSAKFHRTVSRYVLEAAAATKQTLLFSALTAPFAYMVAVVASILVAERMGCLFDAPPRITLTLAAVVATLAVTTHLLVTVSRLRSLREERRSIVEAIDALLAEIARVRREAETARLEPRMLARLQELEGRLRELRVRAERAGILDLASLERLLHEEESRLQAAFTELLSQAIRVDAALREACELLSRWASEHMLPGDCANLEAVSEKDIHIVLSKLSVNVRKFIQYIEELLEEVEAEAEEEGVDTGELRKLRENLIQWRIADPESPKKLAENVIETLGRILGALRARREV